MVLRAAFTHVGAWCFVFFALMGSYFFFIIGWEEASGLPRLLRLVSSKSRKEREREKCDYVWDEAEVQVGICTVFFFLYRARLFEKKIIFFVYFFFYVSPILATKVCLKSKRHLRAIIPPTILFQGEKKFVAWGRKGRVDTYFVIVPAAMMKKKERGKSSFGLDNNRFQCHF